MSGKLAGIARHAERKGPMETLDRVAVSVTEGVHGDFRGARASMKPDRKRQVTLMEADGVQAAIAESGAAVRWSDCRRNLLVDGLRIPRIPGARLQIGPSLVVEITDECEPCERMDELHEGLLEALTPDWRGGFLARVIDGGDIALGDEVRIL